MRALGNQGGDPEFQLVGTYVESPLYWAISTGTGRDFDDVDDLYGKRIGVSRIGRLGPALFSLVMIAENQITAARM